MSTFYNGWESEYVRRGAKADIPATTVA